MRHRRARENPETVYWVLGLGVAALAVGGIAYFATRPKGPQLPPTGTTTPKPGGRTLSDMAGGGPQDDMSPTYTPPGSAATARGGFTPLRPFSWGGPGVTDFPEAGS